MASTSSCWGDAESVLLLPPKHCCCRIRPPGATGDLSPSCVDVGLEGDLAVYDQTSGTKRVFKVDRVFDQRMEQPAVYEDTQPLIRSVLDGEFAGSSWWLLD